MEYIDLRGTTYDAPAVCKYTGGAQSLVSIAYLLYPPDLVVQKLQQPSLCTLKDIFASKLSSEQDAVQ